MHKLTYVTTEEGDWEGIYVDDKLSQEGHRLSAEDYLDVVTTYNNFTNDYEHIGLSDDQMESLGFSLPDTLAEVKAVL
ncbi:MAG: hypothetical protein WD512_15050 [Candidatus Paceibacterota bacterium]